MKKGRKVLFVASRTSKVIRGIFLKPEIFKLLMEQEKLPCPPMQSLKKARFFPLKKWIENILPMISVGKAKIIFEIAELFGIELDISGAMRRAKTT